MMENFDTNVTWPEYTFVLPFERNVSPKQTHQWMEKNWHYSVYYSIVYVLVIFGIKRIMANFKPFSLNKLLVAWNIMLAAFSIVAFCRMAPEFIHILKHHGIYQSVCVPSFLKNDNIANLWSFLFVLSKIPEFGDTIFIVLRKQPLIFLHWYHHILTAIYCWYAYSELTPSARWFIVMNSLIHSIMYSYYALRALKFRIPRTLAAMITFSQILQMVVGVYVNYKTFQYMLLNAPCSISKINVFVSSLMYFSYLVLFCRFFYLSYFGKSKKQKSN